MPRVGDVFQLLSGTLAVPNTTITSAPYNAQQNDWVLEANAPRPISAGGTGSTTAAGARASLGTMGAGDLAASPTKALVVNTDSVVIIDSADTDKTKRWLVSDIRVAFGPASHDHVKLVSTVSDVSLNLGGTPGAGTLTFNTKADGTGTNVLTVQEFGASLTGNLQVVGAVTATVMSSTGTITGNTTVGVKGSGTLSFWFYGPLNEDRGAIYTPGNAAGSITVRTSGGDLFTFNNDASFKAPGNVFASAAYLRTDGNVYGTIWNAWGYPNAYNAIAARIEERAEAWANNRVSLLAYRKVTGGNSGTTASWVAPAGAVVTGYNRESGSTGQVAYLTYEYLQAYDPVRGWVGFTG